MTLTDDDRELLRIFGKSWTYPGFKEQAVREATGLSMIAGTQRLNYLLDTEAALAEFPTEVNRLRRLRAQRLRSRSARRTG